MAWAPPPPPSCVLNSRLWALRMTIVPPRQPAFPDSRVKCWSLSYVWLFATPCTVAHQVPLSMEFSRQEYWSGWTFPSSGDLSDPVILHCRQILYHLSHQGSPCLSYLCCLILPTLSICISFLSSPSPSSFFWGTIQWKEHRSRNKNSLFKQCDFKQIFSALMHSSAVHNNTCPAYLSWSTIVSNK